jgi:glycosyltransferase involved in cell wall biosynthesis
LAVEPGVHLFVADDDEEFAAAVKRLLVEPELRARIAAAARRYVETSHQWRVIVQRYETEVAAGVKRRQVDALTDQTPVLAGDVTEYGR